MNIDLSIAKEWLTFIVATITLIGLVQVKFSSGTKKIEEDIATFKKEVGENFYATEKAMTNFSERIKKIEIEIDHLPDRETAQRLEVNMERLNGRLNTLSAQLQPVAAIGERLQEFLLEKARK